MGKPKAPKPPDPRETSSAQTGTNIGTAIANNTMGMVNQNSPYGSLTYEQSGSSQYTDPYTGQTYDLPSYTATTTLSPEEQAKLDSNQQAEMAMSRTAADRGQFLEGYLSQNFDPTGLPDRGQLQSRSGELTRSYGTDFSEDRQRVEEALFSRLNPQLQQQQDQMRTQLLNQGITPGSEAWQRQYDDYNRGSNDARTSVLLAGGQEQSRLAGLEAQRAAFENSATGSAFNMDAATAGYGDNQRAQALQEAFAMRNQPINEISALLSGSQVQNPMFSSTPTASIPTTDVAGLIGQNYNQQLGAYQQDMQNRSGLFGGLFGAGATLLGAPAGSVFGGLFR